MPGVLSPSCHCRLHLRGLVSRDRNMVIEMRCGVTIRGVLSDIVFCSRCGSTEQSLPPMNRWIFRGVSLRVVTVYLNPDVPKPSGTRRPVADADVVILSCGAGG
jgi:hypothetical protein